MLLDLEKSAWDRATWVKHNDREILIANLSFWEAKHVVQNFANVVSINDPGSDHFLEGAKTLKIEVHDVTGMAHGVQHPTWAMMDELRTFFEDVLSDRAHTLLLHCEGGVSRSGAATLMFLLMFSEGDIEWAVETLFKQVNPDAAPNQTMVEFLDEIFGADTHLMELVNAAWVNRQLEKDPEHFD